MAEKKSANKAQKAVSGVKKKSPGAPSKAAVKKTTPPKKGAKVKTEYESVMPPSWAIALVCFALFLLLAVIAVKPDGVLLRWIKAVILGLIGPAGFYFAIPALLYLGVLHAVGRMRAVPMRSVCTIAATFLCGCLYHLAMNYPITAQGFLPVVGDLYRSGVAGLTGGVLCGGFVMALEVICGTIASWILICLGLVFLVLGAMQITPASIVRALVNRPKWEEEEKDYIEPATAVVNHIANRQIQHKRQRLEKAKAAQNQPQAAPPPPAAKFQPQPAPQQPEGKTEPVPESSGKGSSFMDRVDEDIAAPLAGTLPQGAELPIVPPAAPTPEPIRPAVPAREEMSQIPVQMPELRFEPKEPSWEPAPPKPEPPKPAKKEPAEKAPTPQAPAPRPEGQPEYRFPPIDLLKRPGRPGGDGTEEMRENSQRLNETLASFKIDAHIINVTRGPSVTRYEVELDRGVRLNKLTGCADDIALSLGASGVRIAAVPGKISVVGIEVPNRVVTTVSLREVIDSEEFRRSKSKSSFAVGKDIGGNCIIGNIAKMPHLLIAGTTGSGKSVCMNSIIISLLYKAAPEEVKLIMVDPKMVELGIYNSIPHLLIPVVTDPKKAAGSLQWAVTEMLRRYKMMSDAGVRDLESYNGIMASEDGEKLPQVVIIIDELADLMMVAAKEVEDSICRIAQMGRAAGMHLIIATQRPSADVITGLMKANIPSRIAFSVASSMESRIILDTMGAEKLVGKGDMLFAPIGCGKPLRVQGCFVTDGEVEAITEYIKDNYVTDYSQDIMEEIERKAQQTGKKPASVSDPDPSDEELEGDEMLPAAVDVILETGQASVSMLQRRLKLGYARAARIVDEMEEKGIVGPFQGSKPRSILITKEQWQAQKAGQQMDFDQMEAYLPEEMD